MGMIFSRKSFCLLSVVGLLLLIPAVIGFLSDHRERQKLERRKLSKPPSIEVFLQEPKDFFTQTSNYLNDHFGFSSAINLMYRRIKWYVFLDSVHPAIARGKNGFLFHIGDDSGHIQELCNFDSNSDFVKKQIDGVLQISHLLTAPNRKVSFLVAPSKIGLYPELLPNSIREDWRKECAEYPTKSPIFRLAKDLQAMGIVFLYPYSEFAQHKDDPYFYPAGNYHWKGESTNLASRVLFQALNMAVASDSSRVLVDGKGDLKTLFGFPRKVGHYKYSSVNRKNRKESQRFLKTIRPFFRRNPEHGAFIGNSGSERSAVLITNSYGRFIAPYIAPGFKKLYHINTNQLKKKRQKDFYKWLADFDSTDIIFVFHDISVLSGKFSSVAGRMR